MTVITRFAPSPTGYLHIGGLRTALFNYLFAKKNGGKFLLRIEDTDQTRLVPGSIEQIINALKWSGLQIDNENNLPVIQSQRLDIYKKHVDVLLEKKMAYHCFCTPERLAAMRVGQRGKGTFTLYDRWCYHSLTENERFKRAESGEKHTIRMLVDNATENNDVDDNNVIEFEDIVFGRISTLASVVDDQILLKSDGFPTYHLANVVDDHLMKVTHVIRGEEWLPSTPKHVTLYKHFGWQPPHFAHLPLILNADGSKLSKRQNDVDTDSYRKQGYLPEALINFLAFLGWTPNSPNSTKEAVNTDKGSKGKRNNHSNSNDNEEIFTLQQLVDRFSLENIHKSGAVASFEKARHINSIYIRNMDSSKLYELLKDKFESTYGNSKILSVNVDGNNENKRQKFIIDAISIVKDRAFLLPQIVDYSWYFFYDPIVKKDSSSSTITFQSWSNNDNAENNNNLISSSSSLKIDDGSNTQSLLEGLENNIKKLSSPFDKKELQSIVINPLIEEMKKSQLPSNNAKKQSMEFLRSVFIAGFAGPSIVDIIVLLDKSTSLRRIQTAINAIQ